MEKNALRILSFSEINMTQFVQKGKIPKEFNFLVNGMPMVRFIRYGWQTRHHSKITNTTQFIEATCDVERVMEWEYPPKY